MNKIKTVLIVIFIVIAIIFVITIASSLFFSVSGGFTEYSSVSATSLL